MDEQTPTSSRKSSVSKPDLVDTPRMSPYRTRSRVSSALTEENVALHNDSPTKINPGRRVTRRTSQSSESNVTPMPQTVKRTRRSSSVTSDDVAVTPKKKFSVAQEDVVMEEDEAADENKLQTRTLTRSGLKKNEDGKETIGSIANGSTSEIITPQKHIKQINFEVNLGVMTAAESVTGGLNESKAADVESESTIAPETTKEITEESKKQTAIEKCITEPISTMGSMTPTLVDAEISTFELSPIFDDVIILSDTESVDKEKCYSITDTEDMNETVIVLDSPTRVPNTPIVSKTPEAVTPATPLPSKLSDDITVIPETPLVPKIALDGIATPETPKVTPKTSKKIENSTVDVITPSETAEQADKLTGAITTTPKTPQYTEEAPTNKNLVPKPPTVPYITDVVVIPETPVHSQKPSMEFNMNVPKELEKTPQTPDQADKPTVDATATPKSPSLDGNLNPLKELEKTLQTPDNTNKLNVDTKATPKTDVNLNASKELEKTPETPDQPDKLTVDATATPKSPSMNVNLNALKESEKTPQIPDKAHKLTVDTTATPKTDVNLNASKELEKTPETPDQPDKLTVDATATPKSPSMNVNLNALKESEKTPQIPDKAHKLTVDATDTPKTDVNLNASKELEKTPQTPDKADKLIGNATATPKTDVNLDASKELEKTPKTPVQADKLTVDAIPTPNTPDEIIVPETPQAIRKVPTIEKTMSEGTEILLNVEKSEEEILSRTQPTRKINENVSESEPADPKSEPADPKSEPSDPKSEPADSKSESTDSKSESTDSKSKPTDSNSDGSKSTSPMENGISGENEEYPRWGGSVRRKSDGQPIDKFGLNKATEEAAPILVKRNSQRGCFDILREEYSDEESSSEKEGGRSFLYDEAMDSNGEPSMDEDERQFIEENQIPDHGISLGSDSEVEFSDGSESNDSFIVSDSSIHLLDGSGDDLEVEIESEKPNKSQRKRRVYKILDSSEEESEMEKKPKTISTSKRRSDTLLSNPTPNKKAKLVVIESEDEPSEISESIEEDELAILDFEPSRSKSSRRLSELNLLPKKNMKRLSLDPNAKLSSLESNEVEQLAKATQKSTTVSDDSIKENVAGELANLDDKPKKFVQQSKGLSQVVSTSKKESERLSLHPNTKLGSVEASEEQQTTAVKNNSNTVFEYKDEDIAEQLAVVDKFLESQLIKDGIIDGPSQSSSNDVPLLPDIGFLMDTCKAFLRKRFGSPPPFNKLMPEEKYLRLKQKKALKLQMKHEKEARRVEMESLAAEKRQKKQEKRSKIAEITEEETSKAIEKAMAFSEQIMKQKQKHSKVGEEPIQEETGKKKVKAPAKSAKRKMLQILDEGSHVFKKVKLSESVQLPAKPQGFSINSLPVKYKKSNKDNSKLLVQKTSAGSFDVEGLESSSRQISSPFVVTTLNYNPSLKFNNPRDKVIFNSHVQRENAAELLNRKKMQMKLSRK